MLSSKELFSHQPKSSIRHNARVKFYPDGSSEIMVASRSVFKDPLWEPSDDSCASRKPCKRDRDSDSSDASDRARRRAASAVRDYALCNDFRWFVTLTLDSTKVDRYDISSVMKRMNVWLDNRVRRKGLRYVIVPELHKDGAIHFHGFFNDALDVVPSGTFSLPGQKKPRKARSAREADRWISEGAHPVYNIPDWSFGFSTAIGIYGDYSAAVAYICKYVRKQEQKIGGRWYYSGGDLRKPDAILVDMPFEDAAAEAGAYTFTVPDAGVSFCCVRYPANA